MKPAGNRFKTISRDSEEAVEHPFKVLELVSHFDISGNIAAGLTIKVLIPMFRMTICLVFIRNIFDIYFR